MRDSLSLEREKHRRLMDNFFDDIEPLKKYLDDPAATDISTSHRGEIIVKIFGKGKLFTGETLPPTRVAGIILSAAALLDKRVDTISGIPKLEAVIPPPYNARITGLLPPWVDYPQVRFRLPPKRIYPLEDYVRKGRMTAEEYDLVCRYIKERKNILVGGGTGSGKSTFVNAVLKKNGRVYPR